MFTIEPHPDGPESGLALMQPDGSGYLVRPCEDGVVECTWICAQGVPCHEVRQSPLEFLHSHPEVADIPGVGSALRCIAFPETAGAAVSGRDL